MYTDESRLQCCWEIWVYKRKETSVSPLNRTCLLLAKFWLIPDLVVKPDSVELAYFTWNGEKSHSAFSLCKPKSFIRNNKWLHYGKKFILNRNVTFFSYVEKIFHTNWVSLGAYFTEKRKIHFGLTTKWLISVQR